MGGGARVIVGAGAGDTVLGTVVAGAGAYVVGGLVVAGYVGAPLVTDGTVVAGEAAEHAFINSITASMTDMITKYNFFIGCLLRTLTLFLL
jgi:hypothetical protein